MKTSMKILLAADGSEHSNKAVEEIANRPFPAKTEVRIVTAYESIPLLATTEPMSMYQKYYDDADTFALKTAEDASQNAEKVLKEKNPTLTISRLVIEGSPKQVILEEADKFKADLIVVGSHGYGAVERFLIGSVSQSVALHSKCSVEIVRK